MVPQCISMVLHQTQHGSPKYISWLCQISHMARQVLYMALQHIQHRCNTPAHGSATCKPWHCSVYQDAGYATGLYNRLQIPLQHMSSGSAKYILWLCTISSMALQHVPHGSAKHVTWLFNIYHMPLHSSMALQNISSGPAIISPGCNIYHIGLLKRKRCRT
jgi:hypothetical protein